MHYECHYSFHFRIGRKVSYRLTTEFYVYENDVPICSHWDVQVEDLYSMRQNSLVKNKINVVVITILRLLTHSFFNKDYYV